MIDMDDEPHQEIYFIGIALPEALDKQIADLKWRLYDKDGQMLKPLLPHVTLLHPPSLTGIMPSELIPRVREVAERYLPLTIELTKVDFFGQSVCFVDAESLKLRSLQAQLVQLLPPEARQLHYKRPYRPHVTVAQKYEPKQLDVDRLRRIVESELTLPIRFTVDSVTCFRRILPRQYRPESINR